MNENSLSLYPIAPDDCLVLSAFARSTSLREAARLLGCDPAGLQRKVQRIAEDHACLRKMDGRWCLTAKGQSLVAWADESVRSQKALLQAKSLLRLSSTSWVAEQLLIPALPILAKKFPESRFSLTVPDRGFERELSEGGTDFVIVCHPPEDPAIAHKQVAKEAWVVIAPVSWAKGKALKFEDLLRLPFIRHSQLNPDLVFQGFEREEEPFLTCDNLIGVRSAVAGGLGWSFVPKILVKNHAGTLAFVPHDISMDRKLCVWWLRSRSDSRKLSPAVCAWAEKLEH